MTEPGQELARLRRLCPEAEQWDEQGGSLVYLPGLRVESAGAIRTVDVLLCPRERDGYQTRLFFSEQLPVSRNWSPYTLMARTWYACSWQGVPADQPWLDILASHLEAVKI